MNNLVKFCEWAKENGYGKVQIPNNVMKIFTEYLDHESEVNKLNKADVIKSVCDNCKGTGRIVLMNQGNFPCRKCDGTGEQTVL